MSQGLMEMVHSADPLEQRECSKQMRSDKMEQGLGDLSPKCPYRLVAPR
jgi:hypothetical protein